MQPPAGPTRSVVLLAFHYPPMVGAASERAASFVRHLPGTGWEPIVVTVRRGLYHYAPEHRPPPARTLRTRAPEPSKLLRALSGRAANMDADGGGSVQPVGGPALDRARRLLRDYIYLPDAQVAWIPFAVAGARRALQTVPGPAVLISSSVPYSAHLAAGAVARAEGVPWIAEFRDPWSATDDRIRPRSRARKWADAELEARVVAAARGVVVTSELTREDMVSAYPELAARSWVVRNGFEPLAGPLPIPLEPTGPLELVHVGSVRPEVSVVPLLRGIDRVAGAGRGALRLRVFGSPEPWRSAAGALGGPDWLRLDGLVDPATVQRAAASASAGVVLVPGDANRQYTAAKLMEYLGARRPVLGVISATGEMARLARDYGDLRLVEPYCEGAVADAVGALLREHRQGRLQSSAEGRKPLTELTRRAQTAKLAAILESVL
jgi:hypothetical protein